MSILAVQNRFGYFPWEWKEFSFFHKVRMWLDAFRLSRGHYCHFLKARAEIWRGRVPVGETSCMCGKPNEPGFRCWCEHCNGVLRQGKFNRKGEKIVKYKKRFTEGAKDSKLWEINRKGLRLMGELIPYFDPACWQGYKAGERKEDGRSE